MSETPNNKGKFAVAAENPAEAKLAAAGNPAEAKFAVAVENPAEGRPASTHNPAKNSSASDSASNGKLAAAQLVPSLDESQIPDSKLSVHDQIREYYGNILAGSSDLKTNATCCSESAPPKYVLDVMPLVADAVIEHFYGCGSPIPPALEGCTVVDLGCGVGRDVYVLSKLVGENGKVIGVDMTPFQLDFAKSFQQEHADRFGFATSNIEFKCGYIEDLAELGIADNSVDLVVSNCVINLTPFKEEVFREIWRVLKPGGELYFADVFCDRRLPEEVQNDPVLRGECLGGAMYLEDFRRMMQRVGFTDFLIAAEDEIHIADLAMETKVGFSGFRSLTIRAIKAQGLEDREEDYGQCARYLGTIPEMPRYFDLTDDIRLIKGRDVAISGNMATMLEQSRYGKHFEITQRKEHRGEFDFARAQDAILAKRRKHVVDTEYLDESLERIGAPSFADRVNAPEVLTAPPGSSVLQVNITYQCNLACRHCYLECTPKSAEMMSRETMKAVLKAFERGAFTTLDITGGSPEMHPDFEWFLEEASKIVRAKRKALEAAFAAGDAPAEAGYAATTLPRDAASTEPKLIVRTNLTLLVEPEHEHLIDKLAEAGAQLSASLPYYDSSATDVQRGHGVFKRAIAAIRKLNERGYGVVSASIGDGPDAPNSANGAHNNDPAELNTATSNSANATYDNALNTATPNRDLKLDLVYNVSGPFLPPPQDMLEDLYHEQLAKTEGIEFDNLYAFNNWPLGRFAQDLLDANFFDQYMKLLVDNFNALAVQRMMCRDQVNVDYDGRLYDCEVNHVLGLPIQVESDEGERDATVFDLLDGDLPLRAIRTHPVCYSCAAGFGSSCSGSLVSSLL